MPKFDDALNNVFYPLLVIILTPTATLIGCARAHLHRGPDLTPIRIRVSLTPRCPECETELEESKNFWGGYKWNCVKCNWNKRSKDNFSTIYKQVERIVQREMETK